MLRILTPLAGALLCAQGALATVSFTFDDPTGGNEFSTPGGDPAPFAYDEDAVLNFTVDATATPLGSVTSFDARLVLDLVAGTPTFEGPVVNAPVNGAFSFFDLDSGEIILSAQVTEGLFVGFASAGSVITSDAPGVGSTLSFTPGPALEALGISELFAIDAVFTLTNLTPTGEGDFRGDIGDTPIPAFTANSAFTGTAFIPTPGALALLGATALGAVRRRR